MWDQASSHFSDELIQHVDHANLTESPKIVSGSINSGLASIHSPLDASTSKSLKKVFEIGCSAQKNEKLQHNRDLCRRMIGLSLS